MAISEMSKVLIIAEQSRKDLLLESLQEMKGTEIVPFTDLAEEDIEIFSHQDTQESSARYHYNEAVKALAILDRYRTPESLFTRLRRKRDTFTLDELEQHIHSLDFEGLTKAIYSLDDQLHEIEEKIKRLEDEEALLRQWSQLKIHPDELKELHYFSGVLGTIETEDYNDLIDQLHQITEDVFVQEVFYGQDRSGYLIVFPEESQKVILNKLQRLDFDPLNYQYTELPQVELERNLEQRKECFAQAKDIKASLGDFEEEYVQLSLVKEHYGNLVERQMASKLALDSAHLFVLKGWMESDRVEEQIHYLEQQLGQDGFVSYVEPVSDEDQPEDIPVQLRNPWFARPFEGLTKQYGIPMYGSLDPTPFYSFFQVLFFGLMSADLGYGLLLFIGTLLPILFFDLNDKTKQSLMSFNFMAVGTMAVGLFFGSFFGFDLPFRVMNITDQVIDVMLICVLIGIIHMLLAYTLKAYLEARKGDYVRWYLDSMQWFLMLVGILVMGANSVLGWNNPALQKVGLVLILGNIVGMFIVNIFTNGNPFIGFSLGLFGMIDVAGLVGDIVSYTRLAALGVAGANIGMAFNLIVSLLPPVVRFSVGILLFLALHGLNIFISFLGAYVHSMRLEFVEFFGKFFEGGGKEFKPLKPLEEEVWIESKK